MRTKSNVSEYHLGVIPHLSMAELDTYNTYIIKNATKKTQHHFDTQFRYWLYKSATAFILASR